MTRNSLKWVVVAILACALGLGAATYDDDAVLEFYWTPATGNVDHYDIYVSVDGDEYTKVGAVSSVPTIESPYALPLTAQDGSVYVVTVQAVDATGTTGPMSEPSEPVECRLPSIGLEPIPNHNGGTL